ncbi:hypothetical protein CEE37_13460 [candidate division LCP-89 bacterium B3_LCP]|uniref:Polymerase beta nucleotidyltransferase domain-containing protein n=1 Tax=candidate division LCP-89 bacterium B3_LCP TaxID=2012998 RepID=A0A532USP6_UNCL8|nr:MAG: hypothetical protein CEE37_13460 [candidate division LCP-89 bacterium B3_LCP]
MTNKKTKELIAKKIREEFNKRGLEVRKLILFGSRVRDEEHKHSDWDFLAITDREVDWSEKREIWYSLSLYLAQKDISADILIKSEEEFNRDKVDKGKVTYYANKEGARV